MTIRFSDGSTAESVAINGAKFTNTSDQRPESPAETRGSRANAFYAGFAAGVLFMCLVAYFLVR